MPNPQIIVAVTGGVAAYKAAALTSQLVQSGHIVRVVMTSAAEKFVGRATFAALTGHPVVTDLFDTAFPLGAHIELARDSQLMCVAPATANFLASAATGRANDLISTLYLCFTGIVLAAPAMNCEMWENPAVQRNVQTLRDDGMRFVDPGAGWLSCRTQGIGRMAEPTDIFDAVNESLKHL